MRTEEFIATVHEVMTVRDYTLIEYNKGGLREWCVCYKYDSTLLEWENGTYCYTSVEAITEFVRKVNPYVIKSNEERSSEISYSRMSEIASKVIDGLYEDNEEEANEFLKNELDISKEEAEYFGIREKLFPKLYKIVEVVFKRLQVAHVKVAIPQDVDSACAFEYATNEYAFEPDDNDFEWDYDDEYYDHDEYLDSETVYSRYCNKIWNIDNFEA